MISNSGTSTLGLYDLKRQIDAFGGVDYFRPNLAGGYLKNARVMLTDGDIVKSTIDGNVNDPNVNTAGWVSVNSDSAITTWSGRTQEDENKDFVSSVYDYSDLDDIAAENGRAVVVKKDGIAGEFIYRSISTKTADGGTVILDSKGRKWERVLSGNVLASWFEPRADGITNDSPAFGRMELSESYPPNSIIDLGGKSYSVTTVPTQNKYVNGKFIAGGIEHRTRYESAVSYYDTPDEAQGSGLGWFNIGTNTLANTDFTKVSDSIAIGRDAQKETKWSYMNIAIGAQTMSKKNVGAANIAIGTYALTNIEGGARVVDLEGSRNIAIGPLAMHFATSAYQNVAIGRDAMHGVNASTRNVAIGYAALSSGESPVGLSGKISNLITVESYDSVAVGARAGNKISGYSNVLIGKDVAMMCKNTSFNTLIGHGVASNVGVNTSYGGKKLVTKNLSGTYVQTGNTITVTVANHGAIAGNYVSIFFNSGLIRTDYTYETQYIKVASVIDSNTFTITSPVSITTSGGVDLYKVESSEAYANGYGNTLIGQGVASVADNIGNNNTALGRNALQNATINNEFNVAVGFGAGGTLTSGFNNVFIGRNAGLGLTTATGVTCIGANATVTADNQIQLGNSTTTTYVYGTVQNRSDERDKADIRDTELGLDFINTLRPVDYRLDMREDYIETLEDGTVIKHDKDGSKKRNRYHHGFIAQEVPKGFGGYQDHKVQGGADVLSLGYDEFIAPLVKAVQELTQRVAELEAEKQK